MPEKHVRLFLFGLFSRIVVQSDILLASYLVTYSVT
jgi:hypothetical protein